MDPVLMQFFLEDEDDREFDEMIESISLPKSLLNNDNELIYKQIQTACLDLAVGMVEDRDNHQLFEDDDFTISKLHQNGNNHFKERFSRTSKDLKHKDLGEGFIESDVDDEEIKKLIHFRKKKKLGPNSDSTDHRREKIMEIRLTNHFEDKDDDEFFHHLRVTRKTFNYILDKLKDAGLFFETYSGGNFPVQAEQALQMFLYYMGQRCTYKFLSEMYRVSESAIMTSFMKCVEGINRLDISEVQWPSDPEDVKAIENNFKSIAGMSGIIGSFGGCCIEMRTNKEPPAGYKIGKLRSIMYLLAVTDAHCRFNYLQAGFPGTFCLQEAFESSSLGKMMKLSSNSLFVDDQTFLVGDSDLVLNRYLMVPYENTGVGNNPQKIFNEKLTASNSSKHTFDLLRSRFATFQAQIYGNLEKIPNIIKACCIIHNISLRDSDDKQFLDKVLVKNFDNYSNFRDDTGFNPTQPDFEALRKRDQLAMSISS